MQLHVAKETRVRCGLLESDDYLSAPFVDEELEERINQAQAITSYALEDVQRLARSPLKRTEYTLTVTLGVGFTAEAGQQHLIGVGYYY